MLKLRVFGGLSLADSSGPITGRASQRRRLALLSILAVTRGRSVSRDKLVAWLWPEADTEHARHLLADSLYVLRDALGEDVILASGDDLSLNLQRITADVIEFGDAIETGDRERAVQLFSAGGPFLDGVHLADAPEFDRWTESVRGQLTADYRKALEQLATGESARGNHAAAVDWWRQLAAADRLSSRVALHLMREFVAAGDRASALEFARVHESIVRVELESSPDPTLTAFVLQLRNGDGERPPTSTVASARASSSDGEALNPETVRSESSPNTRRHLGRTPTARYWVAAPAAAAALVAAVLFGATRARQSAESHPSIVVLPLRNLSGGSDNESFGDGMTEELIDALARTDRLRVIASTSAFAFKGHGTDVRRIADSLRVANVLEGDFQRDGARIRLRLRLIDARNGSTRWAESYEREMQNVFALQDDISRGVTRQLEARLLGSVSSASQVDRHRTTNPAAYDLYLRGRHQREMRSDTGITAAIGYFARAVELDSSFAAAYAALGEASTLTAWQLSRSATESRSLLRQGEAAALKAIALDDSLSEGHTALGFVRMTGHIDLTAAEVQLKRALALDPGDRRTHEYLALLYDWTERPDDALAEAQRAIELDPLSVTALRELARALFSARRYDEALAQLQRSRTLGPPVRTAPIIAGQIYAKKNMYPQAIAELRTMHSEFALALLGHTLAKAGQGGEATRILGELRDRWGQGTAGAFSVAAVYAGLGDFDQAFAWIDKSFDDLSIRPTMMAPTFDDLRADPRFNRVRQRMGLAAR
jgi:serine/threonine-protein kinase